MTQGADDVEEQYARRKAVRTRRRATLAIVAIGVAVWFLDGREGEAARLDEPTPVEPPEVQVELTIDVERSGRPARGTVSWVSSESATWLHGQLAGGSSGDGPAVRTESYRGTARLRVPAGRFIRFRVRSGHLQAFRQLSPLAGDRREVVRLQDETRTVHVLALEADFRRPAAGRSVSLHRTDLVTGWTAEPVTEVTDRDGLATFEGLEPGAFLVCAPGADRTDRPPHVASVLLQPGAGLAEWPCTVVARQDRSALRLEVHADLAGGPLAGVPPRLFLERKDDGSGDRYPQTGVIGVGVRALSFRVPPGTYRVAELPLGSVLVSERDALVRVAGGGEDRHVVRVSSNPASTVLELTGIDAAQFPLSVYPQPAGEVLDDRPEALFIGPPRWSAPAMTVPSVEGARRILAFGRQSCFVSAAEVELAGARVTAPMIAATELRIRWFDWKADRDAGAVVFVDAPGMSFARTLRPVLDSKLDPLRPALSGSVYVPQGSVSIECVRSDGTTAWQRRIEVEGRAHSVVVG